MKKFEFSFEKLEVWKYSKGLAVDVYRYTNRLPEDEKYGLKSQMRRSAVSVPSNIAEGSSRLSSKSQGNFYQIAYSSLLELYNHLLIALELGYPSPGDDLTEKIFKVSVLLNKLHKSTNP